MAIVTCKNVLRVRGRFGDAPLPMKVGAIQVEPMPHMMSGVRIVTNRHRAMVKELRRVQYTATSASEDHTSVVVVVPEVGRLEIGIKGSKGLEGRRRKHETSEIGTVGDRGSVDGRAIVITDARPDLGLTALSEGDHLIETIGPKERVVSNHRNKLRAASECHLCSRVPRSGDRARNPGLIQNKNRAGKMAT